MLADRSPHNLVENWINGNRNDVIETLAKSHQSTVHLARFVAHAVSTESISDAEMAMIMHRVSERFGTL